jgi:effector-binding domain-containing protein
VEIVAPPRVEQRPERVYVGIRVVTPFRGMLKVRDELLREVRAWIEESGAEPIGHGFLRLHVIDMQGPMDIEAGYFTRHLYRGGGRIKPGSMPAGRYATLTYRDHSLRANRAHRMGAGQSHRVRPTRTTGRRRIRLSLRSESDRPQRRAAEDALGRGACVPDR